MNRPMTLRERVDSISEDLSSDTTLFSGVLDKMLEKKAATETPKEVLLIAGQVEKEAGLSKEASLATAWETYLRYVNPDFAKSGGKIPPQFLKGKKKDEGKDGEKEDETGEEDGEEKSKKKDDSKGEKKDEKKDDEKDEKKDGKKPFPFKSAAARELAQKLGMASCGAMTKEAPKGKPKMEPKTAAARDLAKRLGV